MFQAPTPPARHARLFELLRQGNLAARRRLRRARAEPEADHDLARRAAQSLWL